MENTTKMTPKDFFLHLGLVATLYVSTVAFITFVFAMLNLALPDAMEYYQIESARSSIAWALSVFIIVYPVFVYLLFVVSRYLRNNAGKVNVNIRRWFIYFTIFITAVTMIVDGIVLLTTFLQGEQLTLRFILKVLTIIIVALTVFWFSVKELKETFITEPKTLKKTVLITSAVLLVLIVIGFVQMGSPQQARLMLEDTQRVNNLSQTQSYIVEYWRTTGALPATLEAVNDPLQYIQVPTDPVTHEAYEYRATGALSFELCATFNTASDAKTTAQLSEARPMYDAFGTDEYFTHGAGRTCFERTIDPTRIQQLKPSF
jgi:hypothetical protein